MIQILQSISTRERVMLSAFLFVCLLIWGSSLLSRWDETGDALKDARRSLAEQKIWLDNAPLFQAQLDNALDRLDPAEMLEANELTAFVDSYAREHKLKHELSAPAVKAGEVYSQSSIRVSFRNITLEQLIQFQIAAQAKHPYIAVEALALVANRADPRLLNARLNLSSMVVKAPSQD
jgi:hypothetical protein